MLFLVLAVGSSQHKKKALLATGRRGSTLAYATFPGAALAEARRRNSERARKAGAKIVREPETQFYGDRTYRAADPEGHIWSFGQTVRPMTPEQWDAALPGIKTKPRL